MQKTFKIPAGMPILDNLAVIAIATAKTIQIPTFKLRRPNKTIFLPDGMVHLFRQYKNSLGLHTEEIALCGLSYTAIKNGHEFKRLPDGFTNVCDKCQEVYRNHPAGLWRKFETGTPIGGADAPKVKRVKADKPAKIEPKKSKVKGKRK